MATVEKFVHVVYIHVYIPLCNRWLTLRVYRPRKT